LPDALDEGALAALLSRHHLQRVLLGVADVASAALAVVAVFTLYGKNRAELAALAAMPLILLLFKVAGLYHLDKLSLVPSALDEAPLVLKLTGLFALGITILQPPLLPGRMSGGQIGALWMASFAAVTAGRVVARWVARRTSRVERCLVVGELRQVDRIRAKLAASKARALVVACLPLTREDIEAPSSPELIRGLVRDLHLQRIIVAPAPMDGDVFADLIRMARAAGVSVSVQSGVFDVVGPAVKFDDVSGMTMLGLRRFGLSRSSLLLKRAFDLVATSIGLVVVGPLIAAIAVAIRLDSGGPVFFWQVRVGRGGEHFRMIKFRSMVTDAEARKEELRPLSQTRDGLFKIVDDPRVTRVGRFLRSSSLDELPQVFNVLRGEMSLVGPRPLVVDEDAKVLGLDRSRLYLMPGMTGPWQVLSSRVSLREMIEIDYRYVANWSPWSDVQILLLTVSHVTRRSNL
jgi:exopolysaccharide biosynthesis polyprenyl glycosylphosphotransferase